MKKMKKFRKRTMNECSLQFHYLCAVLLLLKQQLINQLRLRWQRMTNMLCANEGISTIEVILIIVVLVALVLIFKNQLTTLVNSLFGKITQKANSI